MDWPDIFALSNASALAGWAVLIFAPRRMAWLGGIPSLVIPLALSASYAVLALPGFFMAEGGGYGSLPEVRALLATDRMLVAGWQHYLAFDLLVGCWCAQRLDAAAVSRLIQAPILAMVFMFGPAGFLLSWATEAIARRRAAAGSTEPPP